MEAKNPRQEKTINILDEVYVERNNQDKKWGEQNHPILDQSLINRHPITMCQEYEIPSEEKAKSKVEIHDKRGDLTYFDILIEEISEAASCGNNNVELRKELIQCAAVLVAMVESLDRNGK